MAATEKARHKTAKQNSTADKCSDSNASVPNIVANTIHTRAISPIKVFFVIFDSFKTIYLQV